MREILFRGMRKDNGEWVEGYYGQFHNRPIANKENSHQIFVLMEDATFLGSVIGGLWYVVIPETVSEWTSLCDKNGTKIFEGDILEKYGFQYIVYFEKGTFIAYEFPYNEGAVLSKLDWGSAVKIGSIYDGSVTTKLSQKGGKYVQNIV